MASPFLSKLGIDVFNQARSPTADGFPSAFNPQGRMFWNQAIEQYAPQHSALEDWGHAIKKYVELCEIAGMFPFQQMHMAKNDQIHYYLKAHRRDIVYFINKSKLLDEITIRRSHHKVALTDTGFTITVYAWCYIKDPSFSKWLLKMPYPRFNVVREADGRYVKHLGPGLEMFVENDGVKLTNRWHIGYTVTCPFFPDMPTKNTPSRAELEHFVLSTLWMPILRETRPNGLQYRLI